MPPLSHDQFNRVEELFQAPADLPIEDRAGFLNCECADDNALQSRVQRLLDRLDSDGSLEVPVAAGTNSSVKTTAEEPGAVIDRCKLLQVIGEGGFGVVYLAEQQQPVVRQVALKIIKSGMDAREVVAWFEAERQAPALVDHPGIANVLSSTPIALRCHGIILLCV